jgi:hypothetical protein
MRYTVVYTPFAEYQLGYLVASSQNHRMSRTRRTVSNPFLSAIQINVEGYDRTVGELLCFLR